MRQQKINQWFEVIQKHRDKKDYTSTMLVKLARQQINKLIHELSADKK